MPPHLLGQRKTVDGIRIRIPPTTSAKADHGSPKGGVDSDRSIGVKDPSASDESGEGLPLPFK